MGVSGGWCDQVRAPCAEAARELGLPVRRNHLPECPSCGASGRGSGKLLPRRGSQSGGWYCHRCQSGGSVIDLVALTHFGGRLTDLDAEQRRAVRRWFTERGWLADERLLSAPLRRRTPPAPEPARPPRPPKRELRTFCSQLVPVTADQQVNDYLLSRHLSPEVVAKLRLAKAIPAGSRCPKWARGAGVSWSEHHRLALPIYGATGKLESLRARWSAVEAPPKGVPKGLAAAAGPGSAKGLVLANHIGRQMLRTARLPDRSRVVIVEGEPDFLRWSIEAEGRDMPLAVLGVWSGAWTEGIAARFPTGADVSVRTDNDPQGDKYARAIAELLDGHCVVRRKLPVEAPHADS